MILVVGAGGHLGGDICRRLVSRRELVRGLVLPTSAPEAVSRLQALGVQLHEDDLRDRASLDRACRDVAVVISTASITRSRQPGESLETTDHHRQAGGRAPTAAERTRVHHPPPQLLHGGMVEPRAGFDYPNRKATIYGSGDARISWISLGDVAEFAVQSLENSAARDATLELRGPDALSPREAIRIFEQVGGKPFEVTYVPKAALEAQRAAAPDSLQQAFAALMLAYAAGNPIPIGGNAPALSRTAHLGSPVCRTRAGGLTAPAADRPFGRRAPCGRHSP